MKHLATINYPIFFLLILTTLSGCSPHPSAGHWQTQGSNSLNISRINVVFEGTADIYSESKQEAIYRCFWSASAKQSILLQCVYAENSDKKINFQFVVSEKKQAQLLLDEQLVAQFTATHAPKIIAEKKQ